MLISLRTYIYIALVALAAGGLSTPAEAAKNTVEVEIIKQGNGATAVRNSTVYVHYTGTLASGKKFDSSVDRGEPFSFTLGAQQVIRGWDIGVEGMKVGGKRMLTIPPHLGYGAQGAGNVIPPNAVLKFEIELLDVEPPKYSNVNNVELQALLEKGIKIVDLRRQDEWDQTGLIKDSHKLTAFDNRGNFDRSFVPKMMAVASPEEDVIVICQVGNRSAVIAQFLSQQRGYEKIYNVTDGIDKWIKDGLPVVK